MPHYAVAVGRKPGIYPTWDQCKEEVHGFKDARYKKFNTLSEAQEFCKIHGNQNNAQVVKTNGGLPSAHFANKASSFSSNNLNPNTFGSSKRKYSEANSVSSTSTVAFSRWTVAGSRGDYSNTVVVYTDGACVANGKKGAKAGIVSMICCFIGSLMYTLLSQALEFTGVRTMRTMSPSHCQADRQITELRFKRW